MEVALAIIFIVLGILQIILFFKLWGMTNDIKDIRNKYITSHNTALNPGDTVVLKSTGAKMKIRSIKVNGKYACFLPDGRYEGDFEESELTLI